MPSTYSDSLRLELIGSGEQAGTWGVTTNRNLGTLLEQGITGVEVIDVGAGSRPLLALNGAADEARNAVLILTGIPPASLTLTVPNASKTYTVLNQTDQEVTFKTPDAASGYMCLPFSTSNIIVNPVGDGVVLGMTITDEVALALGAESLSDTLELLGAAPTESPIFTGIPQGPTAAKGTNSKQLATTEFVMQNGVPTGGIIIWSGAADAVPSGWYLCDGQNGTPDLRSRFVLGASDTYAVGATGGSKDAVVVSHTHTASTAAAGNHSHGGGTTWAGDHSHVSGAGTGLLQSHVPGAASGYGNGGNYGPIGSGGTNVAGGHTHGISADGSHTHGVTVSSAGQSGTNANMPPYYALAYIMKG